VKKSASKFGWWFNFSRKIGGNAAHFFSGVTKFGEQMLSPYCWLSRFESLLL
jgi:hypothetical protein